MECSWTAHGLLIVLMECSWSPWEPMGECKVLNSWVSIRLIFSVLVPTNTAKSAPFVWVQANHVQAFNTDSLSVQGCAKNLFCDSSVSIRLMMSVPVPTNTAKSAPFVWVQVNYVQAF